MLVIRRAQMAAFAEESRKNLPAKVASYLRKECAAKTQDMEGPALDAFVGSALERAAGHGLTIEWDLCRFCLLSLIYGPKFDEELGWARGILENAETPEEKIELLEYHHLNYSQHRS